MEEITYSNFKNKKMKINPAFNQLDKETFLHDILDTEDLSKELLEKVFFNELRECLKRESLHELVSSILEIDFLLEKVEEAHVDLDITGFKKFYRGLSPLLLRAIKDSLDSSESSKCTLNAIREAIRISIEDELYC